MNRKPIAPANSAMDSLLSSFSCLPNEAFTNKNFDPKRVEDLISAFEKEAAVELAAAEEEAKKSEREAEASMRETEAYLQDLMESSMREIVSLIGFETSAMAELGSLLRGSEAARKSKK